MKLALIASETQEAQQALAELTAVYGNEAPEDADIIVALGGDGFMLEVLHTHIRLNIPVYGMNRGTIGFLMNEFGAEDLPNRLQRAEKVVIHPLSMMAQTADGDTVEGLAINEVSLLRMTRQAAKLRILIDGRERLDELVCDGALVCTPAGSTAYNLSAHGPVLPMGANVLALTPISAYRPRRWRGAILPHAVKVRLEVLEAEKRPVSAVADRVEARNVLSVDVYEDRTRSVTLLFDPEHNLEERILSEQFLP